MANQTVNQSNDDSNVGAATKPVIRRLKVAQADGKTLLLKRQMPAFVASGMIHVALISAFLIYFKFFPDKEVVKANQPPASTRLDEPPFPEPELINPDESLDSDIKITDGVADDLTPEAADDSSTIPPSDDRDFVTPRSPLGSAAPGEMLPGSPGDGIDGMAAPGELGHGNPRGHFGVRQDGPAKRRMLEKTGGSDVTEAAVARALIWLARQQSTSGYWEFDGASRDDRIAATGLSLLPFLAAGETHLTGKKYKSHVAKGLEFLRLQLKANGQFGSSGMYSQAIAAIALCEAAGMTQDEKLKRAARMAIDYIVKAQASNGSWGYTAGEGGDTSIVGWQIQALKSAKLAGIGGVEKAMKRAEEFLVSVSDDSESRYGYRTKGATHALSAVGLLSRIYVGDNARRPFVARGVKNMWDEHKPGPAEWDMYYLYYATQVVHFFDGKDWHQNWNPAIQKLLLDKQVNGPGARPADVGSWPKDTGYIGGSCGRLGTTVLACLTLEVYYRHLPLTKREAAGGLDVLEGK